MENPGARQAAVGTDQKGHTMDDTRRADEDAPELKQPEDAIKDLEPDAQEGEGVMGGAVDSYLKIEDTYKT